MTEIAIRPSTDHDWPAVSQLIQLVFHDTFDEDLDRYERTAFEPARSLVATDGDEVVGHASALTRDLTVPGAVVPAAHVTLVGVAPTHRRRGLLTRLMHRQLADVATLDEPLAVLWASEGQIYPRFGYGLATQRLSLSIENPEVRLPEPAQPSRLRTVSPDKALPELRRVYETERPGRPGWSSRSEPWWSGHRLGDPPAWRRGATARRATLHESASGVDGYALWRTKSDWTTGGPAGTVMVDEVVATGPDAYLALWRFLLSIDLTRSAKLWLGSPDEPLLHLASEPRRLGAVLGDGLYVRIVDLPAALTARRYAAPVDVVIEVTDPLVPGNAGRWRLTAGPDAATCTSTGRPADLACDIVDLGAAYLGGTRLAGLADAGRVRELRPGTLAAATTGFGWHRAPAANEIF
jgi:predicted acetyltransferase